MHVPALDDRDLLSAMRGGNHDACAEFVQRFRPTLEAYARKTRIPTWEWDTCITEVLIDESMRFATRDAEMPTNLAAYLIKAVYNRYLRVKRTSHCRDRYYTAASVSNSGEWVIPTLCSESALRNSAGPDSAGEPMAEPLRLLASHLGDQLSAQEAAILGWVGQGVSHRQIAKWLGVSYDAATKRIWRLTRRMRAAAAREAERYDGEERTVIERFLRRAG